MVVMMMYIHMWHLNRKLEDDPQKLERGNTRTEIAGRTSQVSGTAGK